MLSPGWSVTTVQVSGLSVVSTSLALTVPLALVVPSSSTSPVVVPPTAMASSAPVMVTVTVCVSVAPSWLVTVKV